MNTANHPGTAPGDAPIILSICIATFKRAAFIAQTLESICAQLRPGVELLVLDGASPDDTPQVLERFTAQHPEIVYRREATNSGFDADYDKAVAYARGEFCWLMTDDDLLVPGAVERILEQLRQPIDLLLVNAEVRNRDFSVTLHKTLLPITEDRRWEPGQDEAFFLQTCNFLSFIGAVIIRRSLWMQRERKAYFGSMFVHMGVIFQAPIPGAILALAQPQLLIRYGNAMWSPRSFEIWMYLWPRLIWSFGQFSEAARRRITRPDPTRSLKRLLWFRAIGALGPKEYAQHLQQDPDPRARRLGRAVMRIPAWLANTAVALYCLPSLDAFVHLKIFELARTGEASVVTRAVARMRGLGNA